MRWREVARREFRALSSVSAAALRYGMESAKVVLQSVSSR